MGLHARLKTTTAPQHRAVERLPFFAALRAADAVPTPAAVTWLRALAVLHAILERGLSNARGLPAGLWTPTRARLPALLDDLERVGATSPLSVMPAIVETLAVGGRLVGDGADPMALVGALYVLEGSQAGGALLRPAYARCFGVEEQTLSYFGADRAQAAATWSAFTSALDALSLRPSEADRVVASAVALFDGLHAVGAALLPYADADLLPHIAAINPEAGNHAIPERPEEIALALRAGRAAWDRFPYLAQRYGERGLRFTRSDSCWLVTLAQLPPDAALRNLQWLRKVLVGVGLPTVILEEHLREILVALRELTLAPGSSTRGYELFLTRVAADRARHLSASALERVARADEALLSTPGMHVDSAALLVASAWVDESSGLVGALAATRSWLTDASRFSPEWIAEIDALLASVEEGEP